MGDVVKLDRKAREARRKAEAAKASGPTDKAPGGGRAVAAVIGGLGSLPGAVVGSIILGLAEMLTAGFISSQLRDLVVFSLLVITLLVKPSGLFGKNVSEKV